MDMQNQLRHSVAALFPQPSRRTTMRVGVEQELITRDLRDGSVVPVERVRAAAAHSAYRHFLAFEPGGQVELSFPCSPTLRSLERRCLADLATLRRDCAGVGVAVEASPVDLERAVDDVPLQQVSPRYLGMQRHFDRIGPAGRRMMRLTASTQLCFDWWSGPAGLEQWRVAQLAGPVLAASFGGGGRLAIWLAADPGRTTFDSRLLDGPDPVWAYADFAATAGTFAMPGDTGAAAESAPFRDWWAHAGHPSQAALDHHLSTLFPAVRPRGGYLEIRYLDVQRDADIAVVGAVMATLLYDADTRHAALDLLSPHVPCLADDWRTAADDPADPALLDRADQLLALAVGGMRRDLRGYLPADVARRTEAFIDTLPVRDVEAVA